MKMFVNFIQIMLVAGMVYPVYAMWSNEQVNSFCVELKSNMTKKNLLDLANQKNIKINLDNINDVQWQVRASAPISFSDYSCQIRGMGDRVATARMAAK